MSNDIVRIINHKEADMRQFKFYEFLTGILFSNSRIGTINTCMYSYYLAYILKQKGRDGIYGAVGGLLHKSIESFYKEEVDREQMIYNFKLGFNEITKRQGKSFPLGDNEERKWYFSVLNFLENHQKMKAYAIELEKQISGIIDPIGFQGYVDILLYNLDGTVDIYDWKTSSLAMFGKDSIEKSTHQLTIYKYILETYYGMKVRKCGWNMIKFCNLTYTNPSSKNLTTRTNQKLLRLDMINKKLEVMGKYYSSKNKFQMESILFDIRKQNWNVFTEYETFNFIVEEYIVEVDIDETKTQLMHQYVNAQIDKICGNRTEMGYPPTINDWFCSKLCSFGHLCKHYINYKK